MRGYYLASLHTGVTFLVRHVRLHERDMASGASNPDCEKRLLLVPYIYQSMMQYQ